MSKSLQKVSPRRAVGRDADPRPFEVLTPAPHPTGFFSFSYSCTELSWQDGRTRVKARQTRLHEGKLSTETFEGELGAGVYDAAVRHAQQHLLAQAALLLRPLQWLPWPVRGPGADSE